MIPIILIGLALFFLFAPVLDSGSMGMTLLNAITKGSRLTHSTSDDDEEINESPQSLADSAGIELDLYTLARVISSEEGNGSQIKQAAVAWVAKNNGGHSIYDYATSGGPFGRQGGPRPVTTFVDPYSGHLEVAKLVMSGDLPDPTGGATMFDAPKAQEALHAKNPAKYKSFAEVEKRRLDAGLRRIEVDGIDPDTLVFYG